MTTEHRKPTVQPAPVTYAHVEHVLETLGRANIADLHETVKLAELAGWVQRLEYLCEEFARTLERRQRMKCLIALALVFALSGCRGCLQWRCEIRCVEHAGIYEECRRSCDLLWGS